VTAAMTGTAVTTGIVAADAGTIGAGMMTGVGMMTGGAVAKIGDGRMTGSGAAVGRMTAGRSERSPARDRERSLVRSLQKSPGRRAQRRVMMKMSPKGSVLPVKMNAKMRKRWTRRTKTAMRRIRKISSVKMTMMKKGRMKEDRRDARRKMMMTIESLPKGVQN